MQGWTRPPSNYIYNHIDALSPFQSAHCNGLTPPHLISVVVPRQEARGRGEKYEGRRMLERGPGTRHSLWHHSSTGVTRP